ncbi:BrnT family toxin [Geminocystis sp. CENA526]|uniref:BrnT family toxin n=1 Tax=Geminocystis sp. CENA526 TaxID=1355871 RepID=UPI003D6DBE69
MLEFEWDENKRQSNLRKHGIDFVLACKVFENYTVEFEDHRYDYGEERFIAIGITKNQTLTVVYTIRNNVIRLISARKSTREERKIYEQN